MNKFSSLILVTLLTTMVSCGKDKDGSDPLVFESVTVLKSASSNDVRLKDVSITLDLMALNQELDVKEVIGYDYCDLALGNTGANSVSSDKVLVSSSNGGKSGQIKFGHLSYFSPSGNDDVCRLFSNELFNFTFDGKTLTLKQVAPGKAWDGSTSIFIK